MKKLVGALVYVLLFVTTVVAQGRSQVYTQPAVPAEAALHRLSVKLAWRIHVPTEGHRDGLFSVQVLEQQILVQTRGGAVIALRPATGATRWRVRVGMPYLVTHALSYNAHSVFLVNGARLFALDRATGLPQWDLMLPGAPTASPVADEGRVYVAIGSGHAYVYE